MCLFHVYVDLLSLTFTISSDCDTSIGSVINSGISYAFVLVDRLYKYDRLQEFDLL